MAHCSLTLCIPFQVFCFVSHMYEMVQAGTGLYLEQVKGLHIVGVLQITDKVLDGVKDVNVLVYMGTLSIPFVPHHNVITHVLSI